MGSWCRVTKRLTCPICGAAFEPEEGFRASSAWKCLELLGEFGTAGPAVLEYSTLFRLPNRGLPWERLERLLRELATLWREGKYSYDGCVWRVERPQILEALQAVLGSKSLKAPIKDHNYLKAILHPISQRAAGRAERDAETRKRQQPPSPPAPLPRGEGKEAAARSAAPERAGRDSLAEYPPEVREEFGRILREQGAVAGMGFLARKKREIHHRGTEDTEKKNGGA